MYSSRKTLFIPAMIGLLSTTGTLSAQSYSWAPAATSVPMSMTSLIILGLMFMAGGSFLLMKSKHPMMRSIFSLMLVAGTFGFVQEAKASMGPSYVITTPTGTHHLSTQARNHVFNDEGNIAIKITVDPEGCPVESNNCDILRPGESCIIEIGYCPPPV